MYLLLGGFGGLGKLIVIWMVEWGVGCIIFLIWSVGIS